jgi:hypothetical protein
VIGTGTKNSARSSQGSTRKETRGGKRGGRCISPGGGGRAGTSREQDSDANANAAADDNERIERGADKWARDKTGKEWHEKWWEKFERTGASEQSVEKSGRQGIQAWWEKWGEQVRPCAFPKSRTTILSLTLVTVRTDYYDCSDRLR